MRKLLTVAFIALAGVAHARPLPPPAIGAFGQRSYTNEFNAYNARCTVKPSFPTARSIDIFIASLKAVDAYNDHNALFVYAGETQQCALLNIKGTSFSGVVSGSVGFRAGVGLNGDGVSAWINHSITPSSLSGLAAGNNFIWGYQSSDIPGATYTVNATGSSCNMGIRGRQGTVAAVQAGSSTADTFTGTQTGFGFRAFFRDTTNHFFANIDGNEVERTRTGCLATAGTGIFRIGTTGGTYDPNTLLAWGIGAGTTPSSSTKRAAILAAARTLSIDLGAEDLRPEAEIISPPHAFGPTSINSVTPAGLDVFQQVPPPLDTDTNLTYPYFPGTDYTSTQWLTLATKIWNGGNGVWTWEWGYRAIANPRLQANLLFDRIAFSNFLGAVEYTTYDKAIGAQLSRLADQLGREAHTVARDGYLDIANDYGFADSDFISWEAANADPAGTFTLIPTNGSNTQRVTRDKIIGARNGARIADIPRLQGVLLDFEVADLRSGAKSLEHISKYAEMIHGAGKKLYCYLNPLNSGNAIAEGVTEPGIASAILAVCDYLSIYAWAEYKRSGDATIAQSLDNQLALLGISATSAPSAYAKLAMTVGIGAQGAELTTLDAQTVRTYVLRGFGAVNFWRYYGLAGGALSRQYNQIIAIVSGLPTE